MTYYAEVRRTVERTGQLRYVPLEQLPKHTGFRSCYAVDAAVRDLVLRTGSVGNLSEFPVYSDTLFIDFDSNEGVEAMIQLLFSLDVSFEIWDTGRRGVHFHIPIEPMFGPTVPESQHAWVEAHATGDWDHTVYRHPSIIRLPGTWHEKNPGQAKRLVAAWCGERLSITLVERAPKAAPVLPELGERNEADFWSALLVGHGEPGRTFRLYHLSALAAECGVSFEQGLAAVQEWAATMAVPPITNEREVRRVYANGYAKAR